jgi:hypothetical protein
MPSRIHQFYAVAFEENFSLKQIAPSFPEARSSPLELFLPEDSDGGIYIFPFGAIVTHDVPAEHRERVFSRLTQVLPKLTTRIIREEYSVMEDPAATTGISDGMLRVDKLTPQRAGIVALTVAQSAAMEYYENIVDSMFARTAQLVDRMATRGTVPFRVTPLHRFIGEAISSRTEVLAVLLRRPARRIRPGRSLRGADQQAAEHPGITGAGARCCARAPPDPARSNRHPADPARSDPQPWPLHFVGSDRFEFILLQQWFGKFFLARTLY